MKLTQEQYDNLKLIDKDLKKRIASYKGFNGSKDKMDFIGMTEEEITFELNNIDIQALIDAEPVLTPRESLIAKLSFLNLTIEELEVLNLK